MIYTARWGRDHIPSSNEIGDLNTLRTELSGIERAKPPWTKENFYEFFSYNPKVLCVAGFVPSSLSSSNVIIGMATIHFLCLSTHWRLGVVHDFVVKSEYRGQGVADKLDDELRNAARDHGVTEMALTSNSRRKAANKFYTRRGWKIFETNNYYLSLD